MFVKLEITAIIVLKSGDISFLFASLTLRTPGRAVYFGVCHTFLAKHPAVSMWLYLAGNNIPRPCLYQASCTTLTPSHWSYSPTSRSPAGFGFQRIPTGFKIFLYGNHKMAGAHCTGQTSSADNSHQFCTESFILILTDWIRVLVD